MQRRYHPSRRWRICPQERCQRSIGFPGAPEPEQRLDPCRLDPENIIALWPAGGLQLVADPKDRAATPLRQHPVRDRLIASAQCGPLVEQESEVDAIVVIAPEIEAPLIGRDGAVEVGAVAIYLPEAFVNGAPEADGFGIAGYFRRQREQNILGRCNAVTRSGCSDL